MPANQSLAVRDTCKLETAIREIDVSAGIVILTSAGGDVFKVYGDGGAKVFDPPQAGFVAYSPFGARFHVVYETDPIGTEEARDQGPKVRSSQPRRKRSASRRTSATKTSSAQSASKTKSTASKSKAKSSRKKG